MPSHRPEYILSGDRDSQSTLSGLRVAQLDLVLIAYQVEVKGRAIAVGTLADAADEVHVQRRHGLHLYKNASKLIIIVAGRHRHAFHLPQTRVRGMSHVGSQE